MKQVSKILVIAVMLSVLLLGCDQTLTPTQSASNMPTASHVPTASGVPAVSATAGITPTPDVTPTIIPTVKPDSDQEKAYLAAITLLNEGKYQEAYNAFKALDGYKDCKDYLDSFIIVYDQFIHTEKGKTDVINYNIIFDDLGRLAEIKRDTGDNVFTDFLWVYDNDGRIVEYRYSGDHSTFYYDGNKVIKRGYKEYHGVTIYDEFTYHDNGKLHTKTQQGDDHYYQYDANGNQIKHEYITNDMNNMDDITRHTYIYEYDQKQRPVKVTYTKKEELWGTTSVTETLYTYNGDNTVSSVVTQKITNHINKQYDDRGNCIKKSYLITNDYIEYEYDKNNRLIKQTMQYLNAAPLITTYQYDEKGNCVKEIFEYLENEKITENKYDKNNNIIKKEIIDKKTGEVQEKTLYEYDKNNNLIKKIIEDKNTTNTYNYEYDGNNNLVKEIYEQVNGEQKYSYRYNYEYDKNNILIKKSMGNADDPSTLEEYEYDDRGNCIVKTTYTSSGEITKYKTSYIYDDSGNIIDEKYFTSQEIRYEYEYDRNGRLIKKAEYKAQKPALWQYEYYDNGSLMTETQTESDGDVIVFKYDQYGNLTTKTNTYIDKGDGESVSESKYQYDYDENGNYTSYTQTQNYIRDGIFKEGAQYKHIGKHVYFDNMRFIMINQLRYLNALA